MSHQKQYDDNQWKVQIKLANSIFSEGNVDTSIQHYQSALIIAKKLFTEFQSREPLPETLTHSLVISYLNISSCWAAQNKKKEQILCLIEAYDFLKVILDNQLTSQSLSHQVFDGVRKIYLELCLCFKEIEAHEILYKTEQAFTELSLLHQLRSCIVH
ncbi:MAG: hypothetical protein KAH20_06205 [Methylococcales bacterium]|nr:hypothetical protein [Methylococcales bacterium]